MLTKKTFYSRAVGVLSKVKLFLSKSSLLSLYYGIFHSHLHYRILACWRGTYKSYYNKIAILQNKAVKIIGGGKWNDRATPFYAKLNILKLNDLIHFEKACFLFKGKFHKLPCVFNNYFNFTRNTHEKYTRGSIAVTITFCPFIEIRNYRDQLNIKAQDMEFFKIFSKKLQIFKNI